MRRWRPLTAVVLAVIFDAFAAVPARAADHGIQLVSSQMLDSRLTELTLSTAAHSWPYWQRDLREALPSIVQGAKARAANLPMNKRLSGG